MPPPLVNKNPFSQPIRTDLAAQFTESDDDFLACSRIKANQEYGVEKLGKTNTKLAPTIPETLLKEDKKLSDQENGRERPIGAHNKENHMPNLIKAQSSRVILEPKNEAVGKDGPSLRKWTKLNKEKKPNTQTLAEIIVGQKRKINQCKETEATKKVCTGNKRYLSSSPDLCELQKNPNYVSLYEKENDMGLPAVGFQPR